MNERHAISQWVECSILDNWLPPPSLSCVCLSIRPSWHCLTSSLGRLEKRPSSPSLKSSTSGLPSAQPSSKSRYRSLYICLSCLSVSKSIFVRLSCPSLYLCVLFAVNLFVCRSVCLCPSLCQSVCPSLCPSVCPSVCLYCWWLMKWSHVVLCSKPQILITQRPSW